MSRQDKAGIFVDAKGLLSELYDAQFEMAKRDRIAIGNAIFAHTEHIIGYFSLAYETDNKVENIDKFIAEFAALKADLQMAFEKRLYRSESTCMRLREYIARIDDGIIKWRSYVGTLRQERHL